MSATLDEQYDVKRYLPPYRNLLNPGKSYDYRNHVYVDSSTITPTAITKPKKPQDHLSTKPKYKSLISIIDAASDSLSIKSFRSLKSNKSISTIVKNVRPKSILELPDEILLLIFNNLLDDQKSLVYLLYVNKRFNAIAKEVLYSKPYFTSTFRVAQFVHTLNSNPSLPLKVKTLDFSNLRIGIDLDEDDNRQVEDFNSNEFLASWRDFKYRDHPLYGLRKPLIYQMISPQVSNSSSNERQPRQSSTTSMNSLFSTPNGSTDSISLRSRSRSTSSLEPNRQFNKSSSLTHKIKKVFNNKHDQSSSSGFNGPEMSELFQSFESAQHKKRRHQGRRTTTSHEFQINAQQQQVHIPLFKRRPYTSSHPIQNRFLGQYSFSKDLPVGFILHLLQDCKNLEIINFTGLSLSIDFEFNDFQYFDWEISKGKLYSPAHFTSDSSYGSLLLDVGTKEEQRLREQKKLEKYKVNKPVYWSDTTREVDYYNPKVPKVTFEKIWKPLIELENVKSIKLCSLVWLKQAHIQKFLNDSSSYKNNHLKVVDCTDSGMIKGAGWARSRNMKEWRMFFRSESSFLRSRVVRRRQ